jgi:hypothetical protein
MLLVYITTFIVGSNLCVVSLGYRLILLWSV